VCVKSTYLNSVSLALVPDDLSNQIADLEICLRSGGFVHGSIGALSALLIRDDRELFRISMLRMLDPHLHRETSANSLPIQRLSYYSLL